MGRTIYYLQDYCDIQEFDGFVFEYNEPSLLDGRSIRTDFMPKWDREKGFTIIPLRDLWEPKKVECSPRGVPGWQDYATVGMIPGFSIRAVEALRDQLEANGELLPIITESGEYYVYNCTTLVDVLDRENTSFSRRPTRRDPSIDVLQVNRFAFKEDFIEDLSIFRVLGINLYTFVTDRFVQRIQEHQLHGFMPIKVWPTPEGKPWIKTWQKAQELSERKAKNLRRKRRGPCVSPPLKPLEFIEL